MQKAVKEDALKRLATIKGHLEHVISAVESEKYCIEILQQSLAVQSALRAVDMTILKGHLEEHVAKALEGEEKDKSIEEVVSIFIKSAK